MVAIKPSATCTCFQLMNFTGTLISVFFIDWTCRNYLSSVLVQELFMSWDHDDLAQRAKVRVPSVLMPTVYNLTYPIPHEKIHRYNCFYDIVFHVLIVFLYIKAARILVILMCKHEFDARYQKADDKLYIAQLYFPLIGLVTIFLHSIYLFLELSYDQWLKVEMKIILSVDIG